MKFEAQPRPVIRCGASGIHTGLTECAASGREPVAPMFSPTVKLESAAMTASTPVLHQASVPVFKQMLGGLADVLSKAEAHATARNIDPQVFLQSRLFPDMFALLRQVQIACDFAKGVSARLAGAEVPSVADEEKSFAELQARIQATLAFIDGLPAEAFAEAASREVVLRPGTPKERRFAGQAYLLSYGLPQFFFHVTTAYAILRHNGVELGKKDYMGAF